MFRRKGIEPSTSGERRTDAAAPPTAEAKPMPQPDRPSHTDMPGTPAGTSPASKPAADTGGKWLMVGHGISLSGEITACDRLIVEGSVQVTLNETKAIEIAEGGRFTNGKAEVENAEISGTYEGKLTVRNRLLIRATGKVKGTVRYGELEIERGGRLTGSVSMVEDK